MSKKRRPSPASVPPVAPAAAPSPDLPNVPWYKNDLYQAVLLGFFSLLLYVNTFGHDFALDDAIVITNNSFTQRGIGGIGDIFAYDTFRGFYQDDRGVGLVSGGRYRPLTLAMFAVEKSLGAGASGHHIFNALWYAGLCLLLFGFVRQLARSRGLPWWFAPAVAGLFAAHPLHTEAVANIKGRDEIVAAIGAVGAAWLVLRAAHRQNFTGAVAGAVLFLLGCLAKENAITFLAVIPAALCLFPGKGGVKGSLKYFLPVVLSAVVFLAWRYAVIGTGLGSGPVLELMNNPFLELENGSYQPLSAADRLATVMHTLWRYLVLLFAPFELVHDYYPRAVPVKSWAHLTPWLGLLLHAGMGIFALLKWRNYPFMALGILMYLAALSIVSNVFFSVGTNMSERFLFLPSFGFILAGVAGLARLSGSRRLLAWVIPPVIGLFGVLTILRNPAWANDYTLFTTDVRKQPDSAKLLNAASGARLARFAELRNNGQTPPQSLITESLTNLNRALEIHPGYRNAYQLRGNAHFYQGNYEAAIADYDRADDLAGGGDPELTKNLVIALTTAAEEGGKAGLPLQTIRTYLQRAEQLAPNDYNVLRLQGVANGMGGNAAAALDYFGRAVRLRPNDADAQWNYGVALYTAGRTTEAEAAFNRAEQLKPGIKQERGR